MKRSIMCLCTAMMVGFAVASEAAQTKRAERTPERRAQLQEKRERARLRRTGGVVREANSAKGSFVIIDAQRKVPVEALKGVQRQMNGILAIRNGFHAASGVNAANVAAKIKDADGTLGVALVEDDTLPSLLVAPESGWAIVNVTKLAEGCGDVETLVARVRKEIMRSLAFVTGGAYMTAMDPLMRDVTKPGDLDALPSEELGIEILNKFPSAAPRYGLKPWHVSTYAKACEEGWAPAPTNEYQKAIWDKVHQMPTTPLKIKPEAKKVAE